MSGGSEAIKLSELEGHSIFMIGISGYSMSGLALLLKSRGYAVSGASTIETEMKCRTPQIRIPFSCKHGRSIL